MVHEGQSKRVHGAFMRAPMGLTFVDPLGDNDAPLNIERDRLGSMRRARFEDTSALNQREYGPYGETYSNNGGDLLFGYTGHVLVNSGSDYPTYYAPYRMYSPDSSRWTTRDPLGMIDGPNAYGYGTANPVRMRDVLGKSAVPTQPSFIEDCRTIAQQAKSDVEEGLYTGGPGHSPSNDNFKHCVVGCEIGKNCGGGPVGILMAMMAMILYEIQTKGNAQGKPDYIEDIYAGTVGGIYGSKLQCSDNSCGEKCGATFDPSHGSEAGNYN